MKKHVRRAVACCLVMAMGAVAPYGPAASPASAVEEDSPLGSSPYISVSTSNLKFTDWGGGYETFYLNIDIKVEMPHPCGSDNTCRFALDFTCLSADGSTSWLNNSLPTRQFTGSTFSYRYVPQFQHMSSCGADGLSPIFTVSVREWSPDGYYKFFASESYMIRYGDFPLLRFSRALVDVVGEGQDFSAQCGNLASDSSVLGACREAAGVPGKTGIGIVYTMVAAILSAGGSTDDLLSLLGERYTDPIPPPPPGHEIVDGYDLDEIAAAIDAAGGLPVLAVVVSSIPRPGTRVGSTNDLTATVLAAEKAGLPTRQVVQQLVTLAGAGVLIYLVSATFRDTNPQAAAPTVPNHRPPGSHSSTGIQIGNGPVRTIDPDESTINEVLRSWYRRIHDGMLGNSAVAQAATEVLPEESLREVARQCLEDVAAAARAGATFDTTNPCRDMRIFVPAGDGSGTVILDAYEAALHDRDAISLRPEWTQLNYMSSAAKGPQVARDWFDRTPYSAISKCKDRSIGLHCDEYPFYSATQGGPVEFGGAGASLRPIRSDHNQTEGQVYAAMVNTGVCKMESAPTVPQGETATGGTPFLVVPMPGVSIPSFFLC